jgi:hypothetical protein
VEPQSRPAVRCSLGSCARSNRKRSSTSTSRCSGVPPRCSSDGHPGRSRGTSSSSTALALASEANLIGEDPAPPLGRQPELKPVEYEPWLWGWSLYQVIVGNSEPPDGHFREHPERPAQRHGGNGGSAVRCGCWSS